MMMNLFSIFDPSTTLNSSMNWMSLGLIFLLLTPLYWAIPSRMNMLWIKLMLYLHKEFKSIYISKKSYPMSLIFVSLFMMIMVNNFMSLFPYIFTSTGHLSVTLSLSLPLWMSFMIYSWTSNYLYMLAHMIPQNSPSFLLPFLVLVETISNIIRPITLAIRLMANMIAGHLLIALLSSTSSQLILSFSSILIMTQMVLLLLEMAVSIIQAYVFSILVTLYSSEID